MTDRDLDRAYRRAIYRVRNGEHTLDLTVSQASEPLGRLLAGHGVRTAALLTAFNPGSRRRDAAVNRTAHGELLLAVATLGHGTLPAVALDPDSHWPDEESVLVLGLEPAAATPLARRFGQNAFLAVNLDTGSGATPELVWVSGPPAGAVDHAPS